MLLRRDHTCASRNLDREQFIANSYVSSASDSDGERTPPATVIILDLRELDSIKTNRG